VLTGSKVLSQDRLFATLDPTTRRLRFPEEQEVIITDTVGFIRDLPKDLKKAFAATLEELHQADLLLHLADASHPQIDKQIKAVQGILNELDLIETPALLVLNKKDLTPPDVVERLSNQYPSAAFISALDTNTLPEMLKTLHGMVKGLIY
jgi:GTP-binding protein HflX